VPIESGFYGGLVNGSPRKAQENIGVAHKPCARYGYQFYGENLTLPERHYSTVSGRSTVHSDRATVLYHVRFLPVDGHIADVI
jgi:hypothetical protein